MSINLYGKDVDEMYVLAYGIATKKIEREWLFRAKDAETGEWKTGSFLNMKALPDTIGQYSGVDDKNGIKIFEGDFVSGIFRHGQETFGICGFRSGSFGLLRERGDYTEFTPFSSTCNISWTVIGNIHDNPEMLSLRDTLARMDEIVNDDTANRKEVTQ